MPQKKKPSTSIRGKRRQNNRDPVLINRPAFPGQYITTMVLPGTAFIGTTTVTTGVISIPKVIDPTSDIVAWSTRFGTTFDEYRVVRAVLHIRTFSSINPGVIVTWVDENTTSAPTATEALEFQGTKVFPASQVEKDHTFTWTPHSTEDQEYLPLATVPSSATFKIYTNSGNFGASAVATPYFSYRNMYTIQFRGLP